MPNCPPLQRLSQTNCGAGRQYGQHTAAVTAICLLPAHCQLAASRDAAGALHLWSIATGAQAACFPGPGLPPQASGRQGGNASRRGWLPTRRLQAVGVQRPAAQGLAAAGASGDGVQEQLTASRCEMRLLNMLAPVGYTCLAALERGGGLCWRLAPNVAGSSNVNELCALCRAPVGSGRRSSALATSALRPAPQIVGFLSCVTA